MFRKKKEFVEAEETEEEIETCLYEVNIIRKDEKVETFYVEININDKDKKFTHKCSDGSDYEYSIDDERILHSRYKKQVVPCLFYVEGHEKPIVLQNKNKGIPAKVLSLLYDLRLYRMLITYDQYKINLLLVILSIAIIGIYAGIIWILYNNGLLNF